jgi:four helix bundle protein
MGDYRRLVAWQRAYGLVLTVYKATSSFPPGERYGLTVQLRRASISVPSNLAEGAARGSARELRRFAAIALGSLHELVTQVMISRDLGYLDSDTAGRVLEEADAVGRLIGGLVRRQ